MPTYDITAVNTAIATTFATIAEIELVQDMHELTENVPGQDLPLAQVYPDGFGNTSENSEVQQITFGGGSGAPIVVHTWKHIVDIYVGKKSIYKEVFAKWAVVTQAVVEKLDSLDSATPFGTDAVRSFQYSGERIIINTSSEDFLVLRIEIEIRSF